MTLSPATFYDDNGVVRLQGQLDSSGGSRPFVGALVSLAATISAVTADPIPFDRAEKDTDSFWDAVNSQFVIPAGKGGLYLIGCSCLGTLGVGESVKFVDVSANVASNSFMVATSTPQSAPTQWAASGAAFMEYADGEALYLRVASVSGANVAVQGGGNSSRFFLQRLGDA